MTEQLDPFEVGKQAAASKEPITSAIQKAKVTTESGRRKVRDGWWEYWRKYWSTK